MKPAVALSPPASSRQIGAIHAIKARLGLDETVYRAMLQDETGKTSAKGLTATEAGCVIERLKGLSGGAQSTFTSGLPETLPATVPAAKGALRLDGPYVGKLRALWISAHDLGIVRDRSDRALCSFIERQTKIAHPRWLRDAADAARAIEALKAWIAREAGVVWPARAAEPNEVKRAVLNAQWARLVAIRAVEPFMASDPLGDLDRYAFRVTWKQGWCFFEAADYATVQAALGRRLRASLARKRS